MSDEVSEYEAITRSRQDSAPTYTFFYTTLYEAAFYFLPIYLGYTAAKKIGATPVLGMLIGGAIGAVASGLMGVTYYLAGGGSNFMIFTNYLQGGTQNVIMGIIGMAIAFVVGAVVTYLTGFTKEGIEGEAA